MGGTLIDDNDGKDAVKSVGCPQVNTFSFVSWVDYAEPLRVAIFKYYTMKIFIPDYDWGYEELEGLFKIYKVFDLNTYKGGAFCQGFIFSHECSKLILKFGYEALDNQKRDVRYAKKQARITKKRVRAQRRKAK